MTCSAVRTSFFASSISTPVPSPDSKNHTVDGATFLWMALPVRWARATGDRLNRPARTKRVERTDGPPEVSAVGHGERARDGIGSGPSEHQGGSAPSRPP